MRVWSAALSDGSGGASRYARTVPTETSTPGRGEVSGMRRMPPWTASSSVVALSPVIRHTGSPDPTWSPSCLSHSAMLPTFMSQPRRGMTISTSTAPYLPTSAAPWLSSTARLTRSVGAPPRRTVTTCSAALGELVSGIDWGLPPQCDVVVRDGRIRDHDFEFGGGWYCQQCLGPETLPTGSVPVKPLVLWLHMWPIKESGRRKPARIVNQPRSAVAPGRLRGD